MRESDSCSRPLEQKNRGAQSVPSMSPENEEDRIVAEAILNYLADCPQAMDTEEGIAEWWLMRQRIKTEVEIVRAVLQQLTKSGQLEKFGTGESVRYTLKSVP